jgi:RNA polymerase sigma-70 factor, ECF subfamily
MLHSYTMADPAISTSWKNRQSVWRVYLKEICGRDQTAMRKLYDETSHIVYSLALRMLRNPPDAEEVTIDVYSQIWRDAWKYSDDRGSAFAWMMNIARSRTVDHMRARRTRTERNQPIEEIGDLRDSCADPEELTGLSQKRQAIRAAMESLPGDQKIVLRLAFFQGLTHVEVAEALDEPLGTVKTRIRSGMMKLREILREPA